MCINKDLNLCAPKGQGLCILSEMGSEELLHKLMNKHHTQRRRGAAEQPLHHTDATTKQSNTSGVSDICAA